MTSISDQFSAVRKAQFDAQFDFFNSMTTQALESASRVAALNLSVSRDAVQRSLGAGFALASSRDPRDVFALRGQAEEQVRSLFAYGRELLGIASGLRPYALRPQALGLGQIPAQASKLAIETVEVIERSVADAAVEAAPEAAAEITPAVEAVEAAAPVDAAAAPAQFVEAVESLVESIPESIPAAAEPAPSEPAADPVSTFAPVTEPVVVAAPEAAPEALAPLAAVAEPVPVAEPKAIVKAVGKGTARAAAALHPTAAPVTEFAASAPAEGAEAPILVSAPVASKRKK